MAIDDTVYEMSEITNDYNSSSFKSYLINCVSRAANPCNPEEYTGPQNQNSFIKHSLSL